MNRVRATLILSVLLLIAVTAQASVRYGIKGGLNISNAYTNDVNVGTDGDLSHRLGMTIGAIVQVPLEEGSSLQVEALYNQKGFVYPGYSDGWAGEPRGPYLGIVAIDYLEVPVLWRLNLSSRDCASPYSLLGVSVGHAVSAKLKKPSGDRKLGNDTSLDVALQAGLGLNLPTSFGGIDAEVRYSISLGQAFSSPPDDYVPGEAILGGTVRNHSIGLTINVLFGTDHKAN